MTLTPQALDGVFIFEPTVASDERGVFRRHFCKHDLQAIGIEFDVAQGNISGEFQETYLTGVSLQQITEPGTKIVVVCCRSSLERDY